MKMIKVKSSNIESIGYDKKLFHLFVEFKSSDRSKAKVFLYEDVNHVEFNSLLQAESIGKVFHSSIKAVKECHEIDCDVIDGILHARDLILDKVELTKDEIIAGKNTQIEILKLHVEMLRAEVAIFASTLRDDPESAAPLHELLEKTAQPAR